MKNFLFLRTQDDEIETRKALAPLPLHCVFVPLFDVHFSQKPPCLNFTSFDALCATSRHGIRALHIFDAPKHLPLFVVGTSSARYAKNLGFQNVQCAPENGALGLVQRIKKHFSPGKRIFYAHGKEIRHDLANLLKKDFSIEPYQAYTLSFNPVAQERVYEIFQGSLWGLAVLSLSQARFLEQCPWKDVRDKPHIFSLSPSITAALGDLSSKIYTAPAPKLSVLIEQVKKALA